MVMVERFEPQKEFFKGDPLGLDFGETPELFLEAELAHGDVMFVFEFDPIVGRPDLTGAGKRGLDASPEETFVLVALPSPA